MRVNVDSQALLDARFKRLARVLGIDWREALGRCVVVWMACYDAKDATMATADPDIVAELNGFGAALVASGLADDLGGDRLRIRGVADRIGFLERQRDRSRLGVRARVAKRSADPLGQPNGQPASNRPVDRTGQPPLSPVQVLDPDLDQNRAPSRESTPRAGGSKAGRRKTSTAITDTWKPNDTAQQIAAELVLDLDREATRFRDHALTNDRRCVDWDAAFRGWLHKADEFKRTTPTPSGNARVGRVEPLLPELYPPTGEIEL
jgi:hypothetical protein